MSARRQRHGALPALPSAALLKVLQDVPRMDFFQSLCAGRLQPTTRPRRVKNGCSVTLVWRDREQGTTTTFLVRVNLTPAELLRRCRAEAAPSV